MTVVTGRVAARVAVLAAALAGAVPSFAAGHIVEIAWRSDGRFVHTAIVEPGRFAEVCGRVERGHEVRWQFDAAGVVDFNIHYHVGQETVYPVRQAATAAMHGVLRVAADEPHCWMWRNRGDRPVRVSLDLAR